QRVIGSVVKPRASVINGNLVMADIAHIRTASYPIVRLQDQDRATQVPQLLRRTESRNPRADNDYVVSMGRIFPVGRAIRFIERWLRESRPVPMRIRCQGMDRGGQHPNPA